MGGSSKNPRFPGLAIARPWLPFPGRSLSEVPFAFCPTALPAPGTWGRLKEQTLTYQGPNPRALQHRDLGLRDREGSRNLDSWLCFPCSDLQLLPGCCLGRERQGTRLGGRSLCRNSSALTSLKPLRAALPSSCSCSCPAVGYLLLSGLLWGWQRVGPSSPPISQGPLLWLPKSLGPPGLLCSTW